MSKPTATEVFESINGFDEIAISKAFGEDIVEIKEKPFKFLRALIFVDKRRAGMKDPQAREAALSLSIKDLDDYFEPEPDVLEAEDSESGKGDE